jgi:DNA-binding NarL/FixJ family response regulator
MMVHRKKVMILDPSSIFRRTLREVIQARGIEVDVKEAGTAGQARQILENDPPDVVFIDIALPKDNGIEFIAFMKDAVPESRIVVLTSHDSVEYEAAAVQKGADEFLSKERSGGLRLLKVIDTAIRQNGGT